MFHWFRLPCICGVLADFEQVIVLVLLRLLDATKVNKVTCWFNGPAFLWKPESEWTISAEFLPPKEEDPEVRKEVTVNATGIERYDILDTLEERISCWVNSCICEEVHFQIKRKD